MNWTDPKPKLPTQEMRDWYRKETQYMDDWDELDKDPEMDRIMDDFRIYFEKELKGLDVFSVWVKLP